MTADLYVTAEQAAEILGVTPDTLYAYVSRKKIRSYQIEGSKKRRYWRADVVALSASPRGRPSLADFAVSDSTAITLLTDDGTFYRGRNVVDLAASATLETVSGLLWNADPETIFSTRLPQGAEDQGRILAAMSSIPVQDRALALLPIIERSNPRAFDLSLSGFAETGADVLRWLAAILFGLDGPSTDPLHTVIARAAGVSEAVADLIRRAMVLIADHELNDTTRTVRAAARTGITPYGAVVVGMVASAGQNFRVNRTDAARRLLIEVIRSDNPEKAIIDRYRAGERIPGFVSGIHHPRRDERCDDLMSASRQAFADDPEFARLDRAVALATELTGQPPGVLIPLLFLGHKLSPLGDEMSAPLIARAAGWIAHALEVMEHDSSSRSPVAYKGPLPEMWDPRARPPTGRE